MSNRLIGIAAAVVFALATAAGASEPPEVHLITAADLVEGARLLTAGGGSHRVSVWCSARQSWSARLEGDRLVLRLEDVDEEGSDAPVWQRAAVLDLRGKTGYEVGFEIPDEGEESPPLPPVVVVASETFDPDGVLSWVRGRLGTVEPAPDVRRDAVRTNQEGVDFVAPESLDAWRDRATALRSRLMVTLGQWPELPRGAVTETVSGTMERDDYVIERITLETLPGVYLSGNLYRPKEVKGRLPMVLSPHGHWAEGRLNVDVQQRCIGLAKLGCLAFMYDMVGYNESKPFGHSFRSPRLNRWGFSLAALQTWNSRRVLDWALARDDVDPGRIACTGESGGGTQTFLLTAIDDRVKVAAPVVMVSESFQGGCECENSAGLRWGTDNVEIAALAAPRPLKLVGATGDWTSNTTSHILPVLRDVYGLYGATDRVTAEVFTAPHNYNRTSRNAVYGFLGKWLLGIEDPLRTVEGPQTTEDGSALLTIDDAHPVREPRKSPAELEDFLAAQRDQAIQRLRPSTFPADWEAARAHLATVHRIRVGLSGATPGAVGYREVRRADRDGLRVGHGVVDRGDSGELVPVVWVEGAEARRVAVLAHGRGKAGLVGADGGLSATARELVEAGFRVVAFDPLFLGEGFDPATRSTGRPMTDHNETYNRSLAADRMRDLETVVAWASGLPGVLGVDLVGTGGMGPLVVLALPALAGVGRAAADLGGFDYGDGSGAVAAGLDLAGVLQFGGLSTAAALAAPRPLLICRPSGTFERMWAENAYALAGAASLVRFDAGEDVETRIVAWLTEGR